MDDGDLTYAGEIMSSLPVDTKLAKLILFGHAFGKLREAIILAAALSVKSIIPLFHKSFLEHFVTKLVYSRHLNCDFNIIVNVYDFWESFNQQNPRLKRPERELVAQRYGLDFRRLQEMTNLVKKITQSLAEFKLTVEAPPKPIKFETMSSVESIDEEEILNECYMIKFMVAGAFYPHYNKTALIEEKSVIKELNGRNPHNTVYLRGFPDKAILYHEKIRQMFESCGKSRKHDLNFIVGILCFRIYHLNLVQY